MFGLRHQAFQRHSSFTCTVFATTSLISFTALAITKDCLGGALHRQTDVKQLSTSRSVILSCWYPNEAFLNNAKFSEELLKQSSSHQSRLLRRRRGAGSHLSATTPTHFYQTHLLITIHRQQLRRPHPQSPSSPTSPSRRTLLHRLPLIQHILPPLHGRSLLTSTRKFYKVESLLPRHKATVVPVQAGSSRASILTVVAACQEVRMVITSQEP